MKRERIIVGSVTIEAACILPMLIFFVTNLLSVIEIYRIHSSIAETLWQYGRTSTQNMYITTVAEDVLPEIDTEDMYGSVSNFLAAVMTRQKIIDELNEETVWKKIVSFGEAGLYVTNEAQDDILQMRCAYMVHPLFPVWTLGGKSIENHYYGHAWTGYDIQKGFSGSIKGDDIYVYITTTGTVYHKNRTCTYLNPSISVVAKENLHSSRNLNGGKYEKCTCCSGKKVNMFYITNYGTNYHATLDCHGLKRTIRAIKLSNVGGRTACTKCSSY